MLVRDVRPEEKNIKQKNNIDDPFNMDIRQFKAESDHLFVSQGDGGTIGVTIAITISATKYVTFAIKC